MRVCYLADAPYVHTRRWVQHFAEAGWDADVISFRPATIDGARVHYVGGLERLGKARYLVHAPRVRRLVRSLRPDLVHALHLTSYGFLAALAGVRPNVVSVWGTDVLEAPSLSPLHLGITRYALGSASAVTATGLHLAQQTLRYLPQDRPVTVVPYGVDLERFAPAADREQERKPFVVGSVGRLSPEKGLEHLLEAARCLLAEGVDLRVLLAGDGPSRARLERRAAEPPLAGRVEFLGEVEHDAVPEALRRLDVFVMPSTWEGFGVAALEASACGLPVVASAIHGIPDVVVSGRTGLLVPPRDPAALAAALRRLLEDPSLRRRLGQAGREFVAGAYRWQDNAAAMERVYREALRNPAQDGRVT